MSELETKIFVGSAYLLAYCAALFENRILWPFYCLIFITMMIGNPLGYDTLLYKTLIEADQLRNYGLVWGLFSAGYALTGKWWALYIASNLLIVEGFRRLANRSLWPSAAFAMLATLPALGFSFLGLLRQGTATAAIVFAALFLGRKNLARGLSSLGLALTLHTAALLPSGIILVYNYRAFRARAGFLVLFFLTLLPFFVYASLVDFVSLKSIELGYLAQKYVFALRVGVDSSGSYLAMFWIFLLSGPALIYLASGDIKYKKDAFFAILISILYGYLFTFSPATVRVVWFFIPFATVSVLNICVSMSKQQDLIILHTFRPLVLFFCALASLYSVYLAPGYFWEGAYPHVVSID